MNKSLATSLTIMVALLSLVIPVVLMSLLSYYQVNIVVNDISNSSIVSENANFQEVMDKVVTKANNVIMDLPNGKEYLLSREKITGYANSLLPKIANALLQFLTRIGGSVPSFVSGIIVYIILLSNLFPNQKRIIRYVKRISPLDDRIEDLYLSKIAAMAKSMVKGTFVIAMVQGLLGGLFLWITGVPYIFFFIVIFTFLSIIPLGGGIITIPIGIFFILTGHIWEGVFILTTHFLIITNVDNLLRPKLVSKDARIPSVLTLLAVFAGLDIFGWVGVIYGPVIMILFVTTIQIYDKFYKLKFTDKTLDSLNFKIDSIV